MRWNGASGAQSSMIQVFDIVLGIKHDDSRTKLLKDIRSYMPLKHRQYLSDLEKVQCGEHSLRDFVARKGDKSELSRVFNESVSQVSKFRSAHMALVQLWE